MGQGPLIQTPCVFFLLRCACFDAILRKQASRPSGSRRRFTRVVEVPIDGENVILHKIPMRRARDAADGHVEEQVFGRVPWTVFVIW